jgi:hypothetical protein
MEFINYLNPSEMEVYEMVRKKVRVDENASICRKHQFFGFFDAKTRKLTICTETISKSWDVRAHINETLMHESVHVAQSCKSDFAFLDSFGIKTSLMPLSSAKENDLRKVLAFDSKLRQTDREAFWMEDKPGIVKYVVKKYCRL